MSLSQVDVAFNSLDLSVVAQKYTGVSFNFHHHRSLTCSSSGPDFHFHQLISVVYEVVHVVYVMIRSIISSDTCINHHVTNVQHGIASVTQTP